MISDPTLPLVSAVIPTRNRPQLVCRAVRSALNQTYSNLEVVVVIDGPDPATVSALEALGDSRIRIIALKQNVGGSEARNIGGQEARGEWIALLDDDDEWLPGKLERQLAGVSRTSSDVVFSATAYLENKDGRVKRQPRRFPLPGEAISEYAFAELDVYGRRDCFMQTSTWMISRDYLLSHPFTCGLKKNQDTDWLLRFFPAEESRTAFIDEPLSAFHRDRNIRRVSTTWDWKYTYQWAADNRVLFTAHAMSCLLVTECSRSASRQGESLRIIMSLWKQCDRRERLKGKVLSCLAIAVVHNLGVTIKRKMLRGPERGRGAV